MVLFRDNSLDSQSITAIADGDIDQLIHLLDEGADINARHNGLGLLYYAIHYNRLDIFELLLNRGAKVDIQYCHGKMPLHYAASVGRGVELILAKNPNIEARDDLGRTPLYYAVRLGRLDAARLLIDKNANIAAGAYDGVTPLHLALNMYKNPEIARLLKITQNRYDSLLLTALQNRNFSEATSLINKGANLYAEYSFNDSLLGRLVKRGDLDVVKYLIDEKGVDPYVRDDSRNTFLHIATGTHNLDIMKYLIDEKGVNPSVGNNVGSTPLHIATEKGYLDIMKYLIDEKGVDPNIRNGVRDNPLNIAAKNGRLDIMKYLIDEKGVDPNIRKGIRDNLLNIAAKNGRLDIMKYLIDEKGMDPSIKNPYGDTPLHEALSSLMLPNTQVDILDIVKYFVDEKGVDPEVRNNVGDTPLHKAVRMLLSQPEVPSSLDIVKYFVEKKGINPNIENYNGLTSLDLAKRGNNPYLIEYLIRRGTDPNVKSTDSIISTETTAIPNVKSIDSIIPTETAVSLGHLDPVVHHSEKGSVEEKSHTSVVEILEQSQQKLLSDAVERKDLNQIKDLVDTKSSELLLDLAYDSKDEHFAAEVVKVLTNKFTYLGGDISDEQLEFSIADSDKYLLNRVIKDGGYKQYTQNRHIQDLHSSIFHSDGVSDMAQRKLTDTVDKLSLTQGIYDAIESKDSTARYELRVGGELASLPVEDIVVKIKQVREDSTLARNTRSTRSSGIRYSIEKSAVKVKKAFKYVNEVRGEMMDVKKGVDAIKEGVEEGIIEKDSIGDKLRGGSGVIKEALDLTKTIKEIKHINKAINTVAKNFKTLNKAAKKVGKIPGISYLSDALSISNGAYDIANCIAKQNSDNPCTKKEQMDNIKSLVFSSVSFIANIAPKVAGPIGVALKVGEELYKGIAQVIDYKEKYGTTTREDVSVFLRTLARIQMSDSVTVLKARIDRANALAEKILNEVREHEKEEVVAIAVGIGREKKKFNSCSLSNIHVQCVTGFLRFTGYSYRYEFVPGKSSINMSKKVADTTNLSRALPDPIKDARMICLPQTTDVGYEKGMRKSVPTAVYPCENAMVIADARKSFERGKTIIYNLRDVNEGDIIGSNELNNKFLLFEGEAKVTGGNNVTNRVIFQGEYQGQFIAGKNATNVFEMSSKTNKYHQVYVDYNSGEITISKGMKVKIDDNLSINTYLGRRKMRDIISCAGNSTSYNIIINSAGGEPPYGYSRDSIYDCKKAIILPYTDVSGKVDDYVYYIDDGGYEGVDLISQIRVKGKGSIVFPKVNLLHNCKEVKFFLEEKTLSLKIEFIPGSFFTVNIGNYINNGNKSGVMLVDKDGNKITPVIKSGGSGLYNQIVDSFELHSECSLNGFDDIENYYQELLNHTGNYKILGIVKDKVKDEQMIFGSIGNDVISLDKEVILSRGGEGTDTYLVNSDLRGKRVIIDNNSDGRELDTISVPEVSKEFLIQNDDLYLNADGIGIQIKNYLRGDNYRHLMVIDGKGETFIPYMENKKLIPFFHATQTSNLFLLTKDFQQDCLVLDSRSEDIERFKNKNDLLLMRGSSNGVIPFNVIIKDFYEDRSKWQGVDVLLWSDDEFSPYMGLKQGLDEVVSLQDTLKTSYEKVVKKYVVDFTKSINITHNQSDDLTPVTEDEKLIGIVVLKNTTPEQVEISSSGGVDLVFHNKQSNHTVTIKKWDNYESYRISTLEFGSGLDPIRISGLNRFSLSKSSIKEMQILINKASKSDQQKNEYSPKMVRDFKCSASVDGFENGYMTNKCLGFSSLREQINFVEDECTKEQVEEFRGRIPSNNQVLPLIEKLLNDLLLKGFNSDLIDKCSSALSSESTVKELKVTQEESMKRVRRHDSNIIRKLSLGNIANKKLEELNSEMLNNSLAQFKCLVHQQPSDFQYNRDRLQDILQERKAVEALVWLIVREHSILSLEYPNRTKDLLLKDLNRCFNEVIDEESIASLIKHLSHDDAVLRVEQFIRERKVELEKGVSYSSQQLKHNRHLLMTSGAAKLVSPVNGFFYWLRDCVSGLFGSKDVSSGKLPTQGLTKENISNSKPKVTTLKADLSQVDVNGTVLLLDTFIRKITGQKYVSTAEQPISLLEAQGYALNIIGRFEEVVKQTALKSSISMHRLDIDFVKVQEEVTRKITGGKFSEIAEILNSCVEKACPGREAGCPGKLSSRKFDKFMAEFNNGLDAALNQPMQQILSRGSTLKASNVKEQQISLEPRSYLNDTSVQGHLTQDRDLRKQGKVLIP